MYVCRSLGVSVCMYVCAHYVHLHRIYIISYMIVRATLLDVTLVFGEILVHKL